MGIPTASNTYLTEADELVFLLEEVPRKFRKLFDANSSKFGLSRTQWRALGYIYRTPGLTQTELAKHLDMERASVGHVIDQLEKMALVERCTAKCNRRIWELHLLPKAIELLPSLRRVVDKTYDQFLEGVSTRQVETLKEILAAISANFDE